MPNAAPGWHLRTKCWLADDSETEAMRAAADFEHEGFPATGFWEVGCRKYTVNSSGTCTRDLLGDPWYDRQKSPRNRKPPDGKGPMTQHAGTAGRRLRASDG